MYSYVTIYNALISLALHCEVLQIVLEWFFMVEVSYHFTAETNFNTKPSRIDIFLFDPALNYERFIEQFNYSFPIELHNILLYRCYVQLHLCLLNAFD